MTDRKLHTTFAAFALVAIAIGAAYLTSRAAPTVQVSLRFQPVVGEDRLLLGQGSYANPGGEGQFSVRDYRFFISNIRLVAENAEFAETDSYHLVRFDSDEGTYVITIEDVPRGEYGHLEFGIGVDSVANGTIASVGDLDPNGRMAWTWEVGYKFVLFEGGLQLDDRRLPLVYHVGFDANYVEVSILLAASVFEQGAVTLDLCADVLRMFTGAQTVDMSKLTDVTFDPGDARLLAVNYAHMVSLCSKE